MPTSKEYLTYVLDLLRECSNITYKYMMSEYILYKDGVIFGGIYDNRFLVKRTKSLGNMGLKEQIPYPGGSKMYLVESENPEEIKELVTLVLKDLAKCKS